MKSLLRLFILTIIIFSTKIAAAQCCGDGVCDPGETPLNCPYDCAPVSSWNCPNTIGSFYNDPNLPITYATAQTNGYCYTIRPPYPTQVCFEYKKPPGGTINVQFMISDNCSGPGATIMSVGSNSTSCAGTATSHPSILGLSTYGVACNQISTAMSVGGGCGAPTDTIITVCVTINTATACSEIYICPIIDCNSNDCSSSNGIIPCPPFNFSDSTYIDVCNTNPNTGIAVVTPDCGSHFSYQWNDPLSQTDSLAQNLAPGTYTVTITNTAFGCDTTISVSVDTLVPPSDAAWTSPLTICEKNGSINLNSLITGTIGGNWSGVGVTGSTFNPIGLNGNIPLTYIVGTPPCLDTLTQNINVVPDVDSSLTKATDTICEAAGTINLTPYVNGTAGGTWSGTNVTGTNFNPIGLSGNITLTYTVGTNPCSESNTIIINVIPDVNSSLTQPNDTLCEATGNINLTVYENGTTGGNWSGIGVIGSTFNPTGLNGNITLTYSVGVNPCIETSTIIINVIPDVNPSLTVANDTVCVSNGLVNLTNYINGTTGGTWSGTGVSGNNFNPTSLSGNITITYTVGTAPCSENSSIIINVQPNDTASFNYNTVYCLTSSNPTATITGTPGGTFSISNPGVLNNNSTGEVNLLSSGTGTFWIYYNTSSTGNYCPAIDSVQITITPSPVATFSYNKSIYCQNDTPNPTPNYGPNGFPGTFSSNPNGVVFSNISTGEINLLNSTTGTYWIINNLPANGGCAAHIDSVQITINPSYFIQLNSSICQGDSILLSGSYQFTAGIYYDSLNTILGCDSILETTLTINPSYNLVVIDSICQGDSILLAGSYQTTTGIYYDSLSTTLGCDSIIQTNLTINNLPVITTSNDTTICQGNSIIISANGANTYNWDNGLGTSPNQNVSPSVTTTYIVIGTNLNNCSDTSSVTVTVEPGTIANAGLDQELCDDILVFTLNANSPLIPGEIGTWSTLFGAGTINNLNSPSSSGSGLSSGTNIFVWTIVNSLCPPSSDSVTINVISCEPSSILIPNVFTPNGDGENDFFTVKGVNLISVEGEIYNRWGQKMFAWNNIKGSWDGRTLSGTEVPDGTYFYIIKATGEDGTEYLKKGGFSLIR
jgi:gliding motility-associated-like protein